MSDVMPPPMPWKKGSHEDYSCFTLEVQVCVDQYGSTFSIHDYQDEEDEAISRTLSSSGENQIAFALFTEALRREAFREALIILSQDREFIEKYRGANKPNKLLMEKKLAVGTLSVIQDTARKMIMSSAHEVMSMLSGE